MTLHREAAAAVLVTHATPADARLIGNLMQLYTHDFSQYWAGTTRGDLNPEGLFEVYPLADYWSRPNWSALLIWHDRVLAGFALVNDQNHSGEIGDHNVGEFFILRKHRGHGVGQLAAELVFSLHPGSWEVAVTRKNVQAREFWRKTIENSGRASDVRKIDMHCEKWNGPIFRFEWH
jgi:predicted acetyltransferase